MVMETLAHIAAVYSLVVWLGGIIHLAAAAIPQLRVVEDRRLRIALTAGMMRRYNPLSWTALTILLASSVYIALPRLMMDGSPISIAVIIITATVFIQDFIHSFIYGPRAARGDTQARKKANLLAISEIPPALTLPALLALV
jgi:uncharacterized membrane protein